LAASGQKNNIPTGEEPGAKLNGENEGWRRRRRSSEKKLAAGPVVSVGVCGRKCGGKA
jgi:hypothetical protein